jgi:hypothetical protein
MHARASSSHQAPETGVMRQSHLLVGHVGPGLSRRCTCGGRLVPPCNVGCESFKECRSDSRELPNRVVESFINVRRYVLTSESVVVTGSSSADVVPKML